VTLEAFELHSGGLADLPRRRARHVITENARVMQAVECLSKGDAPGMGTLMNASHASMQDDFEITIEEIDSLAEIAQSEAGCLGARMTGGGFGGCVVALVENQSVEPFTKNVLNEYSKRTNLAPKGYVCQPSRGVEVIPIN
jgi:galactokinase